MATIRKVERFVLDAQGQKVPLVKNGNAVLVSRGRFKGTVKYAKTPALDKRGKPIWRATVYDATARRYLYKHFATETEAKRWAHQQDGRKERRESLTSDRRTVAAYLDWWLDAKAKGAVKGKRGRQRKAPRARTIAGYREAVRYWIKGERKRAGHQVETAYPTDLTLGRVTLDKLTHGHLDDFYAAMAKTTTTDQVYRLHKLLAQAFEEAVRKGYLPHNPADRASVPQVDEPEEEVTSKAMTQEQAARFLKAAREIERDGPHAALWHLLLLTGLRPGEAFALKWDNLIDVPTPAVKVTHALVRVRHTKGWTLEAPKTKAGRRTVPLPALAKQELELWRTRQKLLRGAFEEDHGFVFTTSVGTPLGDVRCSFERVMAAAQGPIGAEGDMGEWGPIPTKRAGTPGPAPVRRFTPTFRIYDLRHSCITLWLLGGEPLHVVSKLAGHSNAAFTATVYAKVLPEQRVEAAATMDRMFGTK